MSAPDSSAKTTGTCPVCGGDYRLTKGGRVWRHNDKRIRVWPPRQCDGTGEEPTAIQELRP